MPRARLATKRPGLREAIDWIAYEDENNSDTNALDMASMLTVCLAADLFGANQYRFASEVIKRHLALGFEVGEMTDAEREELIEGMKLPLGPNIEDRK